jgi:hypothetical protein
LGSDPSYGEGVTPSLGAKFSCSTWNVLLALTAFVNLHQRTVFYTKTYNRLAFKVHVVLSCMQLCSISVWRSAPTEKHKLTGLFLEAPDPWNGPTSGCSWRYNPNRVEGVILPHSGTQNLKSKCTFTKMGNMSL